MRICLICFAVLVWFDVATVDAQLFGRPRSIGRPLSRQVSPQPLEQVGTLTGGERFLRGNRDRAAFVGADRRETQSFVGSQQARTTGTIMSSTAGIDPPPDDSRRINRPLLPPAAGEMYLPEIELASLDADESTARGPAAANPVGERSVTARAQRAARLATSWPVEVWVEDRIAILTGTVGSDQERRLVETMVSFEPGISEIRNQLVIGRPVR